VLTEALKQLFEDLKFDVEVHRDLTMATLETLLLTSSARDHSNADAFVCCFLTHGKLGVLYTSDAKPIRILDIVEYFDDLHCESLRGKPKMFFIQACLTGQFDCPSLDELLLWSPYVIGQTIIFSPFSSFFFFLSFFFLA